MIVPHDRYYINLYIQYMCMCSFYMESDIIYRFKEVTGASVTMSELLCLKSCQYWKYTL